MYILAANSVSSDEPLFMKLHKETDGKRNLFFPEKKVAKWFFESGIAEGALIEWVKDNFIRPDKVFLDIGAHVGTYAWECGDKALHTYAFECNPKVFCYLAANIALQGLEDKITPIPYGLGDTATTLDYHIRSDDGGGNGVKVLSKSDESVKTLPVSIRTLDSFKIENIGFIKIDVEGFEKEVLMGARETLRKSGHPPFLFESWGAWKASDGVDAIGLRIDLFHYVESIGYKITQVHGVNDTYLATFGL